MRPRQLRGSQQGFSLVEMVVAIVTMAILSIGLVEFITNSASSYSQTAARNQVSAAGRVVIDRIAMELRNAVPESVRVSAVRTLDSPGNYFAGDQCIEFLPILAATNYIDPAFRPAAHKTMFDVVDFVPSQHGATGVYAVIYPVSSSDLYAASFAAPTTEAIVEVALVDDQGTTNEITTLNHRFKRRSANERLFLTSEPISYCVLGSKIYRYSGYGFHATQLLPSPVAGPCGGTCLPDTTATGRVLITDQVDNSTLIGGGSGQAFDYAGATRARNAVIQLELNFSQEGQQVLLNHEVLQQATP